MKRQVGKYAHCKGTLHKPVELHIQGRGTCPVCGKRVRLDKYGFVGGHPPKESRIS